MTERHVHSAAAYQRQRTAGEDGCPGCRAVRLEYLAEYRRRTPRQSLERKNASAALRRRALSQLADLYPDDYERIHTRLVRESTESSNT